MNSSYTHSMNTAHVFQLSMSNSHQKHRGHPFAWLVAAPAKLVIWRQFEYDFLPWWWQTQCGILQKLIGYKGKCTHRLISLMSVLSSMLCNMELRQRWVAISRRIICTWLATTTTTTSKVQCHYQYDLFVCKWTSFKNVWLEQQKNSSYGVRWYWIWLLISNLN